MALRLAVLDSMESKGTAGNERREAVKKRQMDRLGQELELAQQLVAECGVELQLAVRALRGGGRREGSSSAVDRQATTESGWGSGEAEETGKGAGTEANED